MPLKSSVAQMTGSEDTEVIAKWILCCKRKSFFTNLHLYDTSTCFHVCI